MRLWLGVRSGMRGAGAAVFLLTAPFAQARQDVAAAAGPAVRFQFEQAQAAVPMYTIVLDANGDGFYSEGSTPPSEAQPGTPLHVGPATLGKLLAGRGSIAGKPCETKMKHIANTGRKTLSYSEDGVASEAAGNAGGAVGCVFNYSDAPVLNEVASTFLALAETMQAGERLAAKHRFDRLGLDLEMDTLDGEVRGRRALEVGNIRPVLTSIINDDRVIERVRRTAARLLQESAPSAETALGKSGPGSSER